MKLYNNNQFQYSTGVIRLIFLLMIAIVSDISAQEPYTRLIQKIMTPELGISNQAGLAFSRAANKFLIVPKLNTAEIMVRSSTEDEFSLMTLTKAIPNSINMAFNDKTNSFHFFDPDANELVEIHVKADGGLDTSPKTVTHHKINLFNADHLQGLTFDPETGDIFFLVVPLQMESAMIIQVTPDSQGRIDGPSAIPDNRLYTLVLKSLPHSQLRGIAFNPDDGHLYVMNPDEQKLYELTDKGDVVSKRDMSAFYLKDTQNMVFAPSGDQTDDPSNQSLYIMDNGRGSGKGGVVELSLSQPKQPKLPMITAEFSLIQTIATSAWSPPSPDPSGIAYIPFSNSLIISDSEVNETPYWNPPIYTGVNVWERTLTGNQVLEWATVDFSDEPSGVAYNPNNQHLYFSDDTGTRSVYELDPGQDGLYGSPDDIVTSLRTADFGSSDPEGIAYDTDQGHLFVVDGSNREVYDIDPGPNGIFDRVPPDGDDVVTHFDASLSSLGTDDPEGIEYNPDTGNLYILGSNDLIVETTRSGTYLQEFDLSSFNPRKPAGLAYAPSSNNPLGRSLYIVARGVDNDSDPNENDGMLYEISLGTIAPVLIVSSPNGGEIWEGGSVQNITWSSTGTSGTVKIEYSDDNGTNWSDIIASSPDNGTYPWTVPDISTSTALIRISDTDGNGPTDNSDAVFSITPAQVLVEVKLFLEGPYDTLADTMKTDLRDNDFIPLTSPHSEDPRVVSSIPEDITDWVLVELRETDTGAAVSSKSAFLRNDGRIVADDGTTEQISMDISENNYFIVINHRNHLAVMTATSHQLNSSSSTLYDFSTGTGQYYGSGAKELETGVFGMYTGDANGNQQVQNDDKNVDWAAQVGAAGYRGADFNLNGQVQNDDKNVYWNANVGAGTQVP